MSLYPDYLIPIADVRFPKVFDQWTYNLMVNLNTSPLTYNYIDTFEFYISAHGATPEVAIRRDIKASLTRFQIKPTQNIIIGYDTDYCSLDHMGYIIQCINLKRRRLDYDISKTTAFALTTLVDTEMLDHQIPKLNLLLVAYHGPKEFLDL
jgi:hypothetical protein